MIFVQSLVKVSDNSGARVAQCIRILNKPPRYSAHIGDILVVVIKRITPHKKVKKGSIHKAVVVRCAKNLRRLDGSLIKFKQSAVVLLQKNTLPIATRVFGPVCKELRKLKYFKIISLATIAI